MLRPSISYCIAMGVWTTLALAGSCKTGTSPAKDPVVSEPWVLQPEFSPVREVLMAWDEEFEFYYEDLVRALASESDITLVAAPEQYESVSRFRDRLAGDAGQKHRLEVASFPIESLWMRDFGPMVVRRGFAEAVVDMHYEARDADDDLASALAKDWLDVPTEDFPLRFQGGNLQTDGEGNCFVTTHILIENPDYSETEIREHLRRGFGCLNTEILLPLMDEPTGHVDMLLTVTGPKQLIIGKYGQTDKVASQAREALDITADELSARGYLVRRVPMPPPLGDTHRSYTNSLAVNQVVLVPSYANQDQEEFLNTLATFAEAYPGRSITSIDASQIIEFKGAIHCTLMTIPK